MEGMRAWCALNHACHSVIALLARQGHLGAQWHQLMTWGRCIGTTDIQASQALSSLTNLATKFMQGQQQSTRWYSPRIVAALPEESVDNKIDSIQQNFEQDHHVRSSLYSQTLEYLDEHQDNDIDQYNSSNLPEFVAFHSKISWEEVRDTVANIDKNLRANHVEAAFCHLKQFKPPIPTDFLDDLAQKAIDDLDALSMRNLCSLFYSSSRMGYLNQDFLEALSQQFLSLPKPLTITPWQIANLMYGLGQLHRRKRRESGCTGATFSNVFPSQDELVRVLIDHIVSSSLSVEFSECDLVSLLQGIALLQAKDRQQVMDLLLSDLRRADRLACLNEGQIMRTIHALALLNIDDSDLLNGLCGEIVAMGIATGFKDEEISTIIYSLGILKHYHPGAINLLLEELVDSDRLPRMPEKSIVNILYGLSQHPRIDKVHIQRFLPCIVSEASRQDRQSRYTDQGLTLLVYSLGQLYFEEQQLLEPIVEEIMDPKRLRQFTDQGLSCVLYGLMKMRYNNVKFLELVSAEIRRNGRIQRFADQALSVIPYCFSLFGHLDNKLMTDIAKEYMKRLKRLDEKHLASFIYSIGKVGFSDTTLVMPLLRECCNPDRKSRWLNHHPVNMLRTMSNLRLSDMHMVRALVSECAKPHRLAEYSALEMSNLVVSIGKLARGNHSSIQGADAIFSEAMRPERLKRFTEGQLRMVVYAAGLLTFQTKTWMRSLVTEIRQAHRLRNLKSHDLVDIMFSMVLARCNDVDLFRRMALELMEKHRNKGMGWNFVKAIHAANSSGYRDIGQAIMSVVTPACRQMQLQPDLSGKGLCSLLYNLFTWCRLANGDNEAVQELIVSLSKNLAAPGILEGVHTSLLEKLLTRAGSQSFCDHEAVDPVVQEIIRSENLSSMSANELLITFRLVTRLRMKRCAEYGTMIALHMQDEGLLSTYTCDQLVEMMGVLSALGCKDRRVVDAVFDELSKPKNMTRLHPSDWARVMESVSWAGAGAE